MLSLVTSKVLGYISGALLIIVIALSGSTYYYKQKAAVAVANLKTEKAISSQLKEDKEVCEGHIELNNKAISKYRKEIGELRDNPKVVYKTVYGKLTKDEKDIMDTELPPTINSLLHESSVR